MDDFKRNTTVQLRTASKKEFQLCFDMWKTYKNKSIQYQEDYFEENQLFIH